MVFGLDVAEAVFRRLDPLLDRRPRGARANGWSEPPAPSLELEGDARALLTGERVALNFLQHLSGHRDGDRDARSTRCAGPASRCSTRARPRPGLRALEKQAVAAGGGRNHRMGLHDAMLVKDNHIALAGGVGEATRRALVPLPEEASFR